MADYVSFPNNVATSCEDGAQLSRWQHRKQHRHATRNKHMERLTQLESENMILRSRIIALEQKLNHHPLNLERYDEQFNQRTMDIKLPENHTEASRISHRQVISPMDSNFASPDGFAEKRPGSPGPGGQTAESIVEVPRVVVTDVVTHDISTPPISPPPPRDKRNGFQCQLCRQVFESKNKLFDHLESACLAGRLERSTTEPSKAQRRRWKSRERNRKETRKESVLHRTPAKELRKREHEAAKASTDNAGSGNLMSPSVSHNTAASGGSASGGSKVGRLSTTTVDVVTKQGGDQAIDVLSDIEDIGSMVGRTFRFCYPGPMKAYGYPDVVVVEDVTARARGMGKSGNYFLVRTATGREIPGGGKEFVVEDKWLRKP